MNLLRVGATAGFPHVQDVDNKTPSDCLIMVRFQQPSYVFWGSARPTNVLPHRSEADGLPFDLPLFQLLRAFTVGP